MMNLRMRTRSSDRDLLRSWERSHEAKKLTIFRSENACQYGLCYGRAPAISAKPVSPT